MYRSFLSIKKYFITSTCGCGQYMLDHNKFTVGSLIKTDCMFTF